jgi:perosamine synthetase
MTQPPRPSASDVSGQVLTALGRVIGDRVGPFPLHEPEFRGHEWEYVKECLDTGWVSSVGRFVDRFEHDLAQIIGAKHAVAMSNGTVALQVALRLLQVGRDDEVLVPALTFIATANAVVHAGAIPHFVDSDPDRISLDPLALGDYLATIAEKSSGACRNKVTGRRLAAVVPMHAFGHMTDMVALNALCADWGIAVLEDAAESLGSSIGGQAAGTFGRLATFSFNGNKIVTTGGGGAIVTNDSALAAHAKHLSTTAKRAHAWEFYHDEVGYNFRMPNINAALGCAQLEMLPQFLAEKRALALRYEAAFQSTPNLHFMREPDGTVSNYWLCTVKMLRSDMAVRDAVLKATNDAGYFCRPAWTLMHKLPMFTDCPRASLPVAEALESSLINLPSTPRLGRSP